MAKLTEEILDQMEKDGKTTVGVAVNDIPIWLFRYVRHEAHKWYGGSYAPVLVDLFKKAQMYEEIMDIRAASAVEEPVEEEKEEETISLMGGAKAKKR